MASLSAARCAYILGCRETLSRLVACGKEESAHDKLGSATSLSARTPFDGGTVVMTERKDKARTKKMEKRGQDRARHGVFWR